MEQVKNIRWKLRFANFEKSYALLHKYIEQAITTEIERAGMIQFYEIAFEISWKIMKDYLEEQMIYVKTPRDAIKKSYQIGLIDNAHIWIDALTDRNLTVHTYDEKLAEKVITDIVQIYYPELKKLYEILKEEYEKCSD